jgi:hypothetical protein
MPPTEHAKNEIIYQWREPRTPQRYLRQHASRKDWLEVLGKRLVRMFLLVFGCVAFGILAVAVVRKTSPAISLETVAICILCWLGMWGLDVLPIFLQPVDIIMRETDIQRIGLDGRFTIAYTDIQRYAILERDFDGTTARALELHLINGNTVILELAPEITEGHIQSVLQRKQIALS